MCYLQWVNRLESKSMLRCQTIRLQLVVLLVACIFAGCPIRPGPGPGPGPQPTQEILDLETEAFDLVNDEREGRGGDALIWDDDLTAVARAHSQDMVDRGFFSHTNPDGKALGERLQAAGIAYRMAGENIAWNQGYADPAGTAVDGWMNSSGHRDNILRTAFTHSGMGVAKTASDAYYFTQVFVDYTKGREGAPTVEFYGGPMAVSSE